MVTKSEEAVVRISAASRAIYLIALLFFALPFVSQGLGTIRALRIATSMSTIERMASSYLLALVFLLALFLALRAYWVIAGKTRLDSPAGGAVADILRNTGIAFLYAGVAGYLLIVGLLAINLAPAIFMIFALPFKSMAPYGLLFFEAGRMLAYEANKA